MADADAETIFYALAGRCIVEAAEIDRVLFELFAEVLGVTQTQAAVLFYRSTSLKEHVILTDKLVTEKLADAQHLLSTWQILKKSIGGFLEFRNKIAHHPTTLFEHILYEMEADGTYGEGEKTTWFAFVEEHRKRPWLDPAERLKLVRETQIVTADLEGQLANARAVKSDLRSFQAREDVGRLLGRTPEPRPQASRPTQGRSRSITVRRKTRPPPSQE